MTVDVEDYFHVAALSKVIHPDQWDTLEYRVERSTDRLLGIFSDAGITATFFVLGWVAKKSPQLVRAIHAAGHEVASHGMSHKLVYNQSEAEFREETQESKACLEDLIAGPVLGYRASTYSITSRSLWALDVLHELGFEYDSSIFPIRHDLYGIPDAPKRPGYVTTPRGHKIVEFPMCAAKLLGLDVPVSGGGYFRLLPYQVTQWGLRKLNNHEQRPFAFYLHPWEIDPGQPRIRASLLSRFRHYTNLSVTEQRLRVLLREFKFSSMSAVLCELGLLAPSAR